MNARSSALAAICTWSAGTTDRPTDPWSHWAAAVRLMAQGHYRLAFETLRGLLEAPEVELAGLASATIASGYRQLGCHSKATGYDDRAIAASGTAVLDGLVGRAADEIGLGQPAGANAYLDRARAHLAREPDLTLRGQTRIGWVSAELALMTGNPAVEFAQAALDSAREMSSERHVIKSRLIRGVAWTVAGQTAAQVELKEVMREAHRLGIRTLVWPAALVLGDALPNTMRPYAVEAVQFIANNLPQDAGDRWFETVAPLRSGPSG